MEAWLYAFLNLSLGGVSHQLHTLAALPGVPTAYEAKQ